MCARRAFTLIELLVIIGIIGAMITVSVVSVRAGEGAARVKGATRDVFAVIRHARSVALVTQQPAIITYSTVEEDGEAMAKIEITSTKLMSTDVDMSNVQTLSGLPLQGDLHEVAHLEKEGGDAIKGEMTTQVETGGESEKGDGNSVEDILFSQISTDVVKGMRIKVTKGDDELRVEDETAPSRSKISVFSNVDYLIGRYKTAKQEAAQKAANDQKDAPKETAAKSDGSEEEEEVSIVWETNGRVDPHRVWIYPDGASPESGLSIKVDRFGAVKVLAAGEKDDD